MFYLYYFVNLIPKCIMTLYLYILYIWEYF